jgi:hypothetical protein
VDGVVYLSVRLHTVNSLSLLYFVLSTCRCKKNFDYSDHLVLLLTHFITVAALELTYVLHASNLQPMSKYSATILSAVGISLLAYRTLLFTGMFFHTTYENLVGLGLYILLIQLPLWALSGTRLFRSMFI